MGPLTSAGHRDRVLAYCKMRTRRGRRDPHRRPSPHRRGWLLRGYYVRADCRACQPQDRVCREEVFGPFVSVSTFKDEDEVIAHRQHAPTVWAAVCGRRICARASRGARHASWHGLDQLLQAGQSRLAVRRRAASGYGREMGFEAMHDYTEAKSVWVNVDAAIPPWYPR
jgi:aldehyde dehydrogenase (NAD+)